MTIRYEHRNGGRGAIASEGSAVLSDLQDSANGFQDITPQVHAYLQSIDKDTEFAPIYYNPQKKLYANFYGRGSYLLQESPHLAVTDNSPWYSSILETLDAAMTGWGPALFALSAGGSSVLEAGAEQGAEEITTAAIANDAAMESSMLDYVPDIAPDLLEGGEGINIFVSDPALDIGGFTTNPSIADLEMGGEGAGLPSITPNASNFPSLDTISKGASTVMRLMRDNEVGRAQVAQARNASATPSMPSRITPNYAPFAQNPGGGVLSGPGATASGFLSNTPTLVIGFIVFIFAILILKR